MKSRQWGAGRGLGRDRAAWCRGRGSRRAELVGELLGVVDGIAHSGDPVGASVGLTVGEIVGVTVVLTIGEMVGLTVWG